MVTFYDRIKASEKLIEELKYQVKTMQAVERGAALLDTYVPDWPTRIDVAGLEMSNTDQCILGQVFMNKVTEQIPSGYAYGYRAFKDDDYEASRYGFDMEEDYPGDTTLPWWSFLAELWVEQIKDRLDKGVPLRSLSSAPQD